MKLRSGAIVSASQQMKNIEEFTPQFFDDSSKAWKANKQSIGNGMYKYKKSAWTVYDDAGLIERVISDVVVPRRSQRLLDQAKQVQDIQTVRRSSRLAMKY